MAWHDACVTVIAPGPSRPLWHAQHEGDPIHMRTASSPRFAFALLCTLVCAASPNLIWAAEPTTEEILDRMLDAVGGLETFSNLGVLELNIREEETTADGSSAVKTVRAYVSTVKLEHLRLERPDDIVAVRSGDSGWVAQRGVLDVRPQAPGMAVGFCHQRLFPLLLPFSLTMEGVTLSGPVASELQGIPTWLLIASFRPNFFSSPVMNTTWKIHVSQKDHTVLSAEFVPPLEFASVAREGIRYRILGSQPVGGTIRLPTNILMEGIDSQGVATPHASIVKSVAAVHGPFDPTLFLSPKRLQEIEEGD